MQKVKVTRYVSGRRPEYAQSDSESESSDDDDEEEVGVATMGGAEEGEEELGEGLQQQVVQMEELSHVDDRRLRRLREIQGSRSAVGSRYVT